MTTPEIDLNASIEEARQALRENANERQRVMFEQIRQGCAELEDVTIPRIPRAPFVDLYLPVFCNLPHLPRVKKIFEDNKKPLPTLATWNSFTGRIATSAWVVADNNPNQGLIKVPPLIQDSFVDMFSSVKVADKNIDLCKTIQKVQKQFEDESKFDPKGAAKTFGKSLEEIGAVTLLGFKNLDFKTSEELKALHAYFAPEVEELKKAFLATTRNNQAPGVTAPGALDDYELDE